MNELFRFILLGLAVGALYALTAQGLVLIHRGSGVVNLAQGAVGMVGAYLFYRVGEENEWPSVVTWLLALGVPAAIGAATHLLVMARLRQASPLVRLVATLGIFFVIVAAVQQVWGEEPTTVTSPLPTTTRFPLGGQSGVSEDRLWLILIAVVASGVLWAVYRWTSFGHATAAVAENPAAASALGISPDVVATLNWAFGCALAALTAVLLAPILSLSVAALAFTVLRSLAAALVGRFRSFGLTLAGAMGIGVIESLVGRYAADEEVVPLLPSDGGLVAHVFTPQALARASGFFVIIAVLVIGGRSLPLRSELLDRMPVLGTGRLRWKPTIVVVVLGCVLLSTASLDFATAAITTMGTAIVVLSVVVVTGYSGQVSLAQVGLAGIGAWTAAGLIANHDVPLPLGMLLGVAITVPVGLIVAVPALRTRGVNLAVLTFGMTVVLDELIFRNPALNGGLSGHVVGELELFGWSLDAFDHPDRYGALVLVVLALCCLAVANLRRSGTGRRMVAIRGNERAAAALGIDVLSTKAVGFAFGSALAATGGILLAFSKQSITYAGFDAFSSIEVLVFATIGGVGFVVGALIAGLLAAGGLVSHLAGSSIDDNGMALLSGGLLLVMLVANPNGLAFTAARAAHLVRRRAGRDRTNAGPTGLVDPILAPGTVGGAGLDEHLVGRELSVEDVTVRFGGVVALDGVSLTVRPGEVVGLIGANGAGKTTFIDAVTGFVRAEPGGVVALDGRELQSLRAVGRARAGVGRSFQSLELFEDMTIRENLLAAHDERRWTRLLQDLVRPPVQALAPAAEAAVAHFDLAICLDRRPSELSYGQRRLASVARAIAASPSAILLDEPAAGLSEAESRELGDVVRWLAKTAGLAVLLVEHDVGMVMSCCDRVAVLDFGRKIADGIPADVLRSEAVIAAYVGGGSDEVEAASELEEEERV